MVRGTEVAALETTTESKLSVVFMGSDDFSVPSLDACLDRTDVRAIYTRPDRRVGRGRKTLAPSPVKSRAAEFGLHLEQPERFDNRCSERLREFGADLIVVAAYGLLLPPAALAAARLDAINVHASLLPRFRGAAPVAAAILAGDRETGVTVMKLRPELDAGEILCPGREPRRARKATPIGAQETAGQLRARLALMGGDLLAEVFAAFETRSVTYEVQDETQATYAPALKKADGRINWAREPEHVARHVRAMTPWPGAFADLHLAAGRPLRVIVLDARSAQTAPAGDPGRVTVLGGSHLLVAAKTGAVELLRLKPAGRKAMTAADFVRGCRPVQTDSGPGGGCWFGTA